jgi:hypothetical protein
MGAIQYYFNLWLGICLYADGVKQIKCGNTIMWPIPKDLDTEAADGTTNAEYGTTREIWGGKESGGGQDGRLQFMYGGPAQVLPDHIHNEFGENIPEARGIFSVVFGEDTKSRGFYWGTSTYPKWPKFLVKNTDADVRGDTVWKQSISNVGSDDDFNPIHAIREWLVDEYVGASRSTFLIGTSFDTAAQTMYDEGYGLSYVLDSTPDKIQGYIDAVSEIIDGFLYFEPNTGQFEISLYRDDFNPGSLEEFDEDNFYVTAFHRPSAGKSPSRVVVKFTNRKTGDVDTAVDEDRALLEIQGGRPIIEELDYQAFICSRTVAELVAARAQKSFSAMSASLELTCTRSMSHLHQGSVIKISYPELGISSMIFRVLSVFKGDMTDGIVIIKGVEDMYSTVYTVYGTPSDPASNPDYSPLDTTSEIEYYTSITETGPYV